MEVLGEKVEVRMGSLIARCLQGLVYVTERPPSSPDYRYACSNVMPEQRATI